MLAAQPVADVAARYGAGNFQENVMYIFSHGGAFTTTLIYAGWLATRRAHLERVPLHPGLKRLAAQLPVGLCHRPHVVPPILLLWPRPPAHGAIPVFQLGDPHDHLDPPQQRLRRRDWRMEALPADD